MEKLVPISEEESARINIDGSSQMPNLPSKKIVIYRECLRNHAAAMGVNVTDGCGEFMPTDDEPLICSACNCHRNFHRKLELEADEHHPYYFDPNNLHSSSLNNVVPFSSYMGGNPVISDEMEDNGGSKKRFRTKFSSEQKEKMLEFAESVGWKMQKQEEAGVQKLCQEIGVKRRVLKVWMHNNKHHFAKKKNVDDDQSSSQNQDQS